MGHQKRRSELERNRALQEARRSQRRAKRAQRSTGSGPGVDIGAVRVLKLCLRGGKVEGYEALRKCDTLRIYVPRFRYHEHLQKATMAGEVSVELPEMLARDVERAVSPIWTKGRMVADAEA